MRERTRLEAELVALGSRADNRLPREFEFPAPSEYEAPAQSAGDKLEAFRIKGGLYTHAERSHAAAHPKGLMLTPVVGKEERRLVGRAPAGLSIISKEMARFEDGKLGEYVQSYNDFCDLFEEVLRHIGRLRDLLSAGAPESPTDLSVTQKSALRPTDNSNPNASKKTAYGAWRDAQARYAVADNGGNLVEGRVHEMLKASRAFELARQNFWQRAGEFRRAVDAAKRLHKPTFDIDIKLSDVAEVMQGPLGLLHVVDYALEARSKRKEYDAKMKTFGDMVKNSTTAMRDLFEAMKNAGEVYWEKLVDYRTGIDTRNGARVNARKKVMLLGQEMAPRSEKRNPVLAAIRMPGLVSDAWRALATIGPAALRKLQAVLGSEELLNRANFNYSRNDPFGVGDMAQIRQSFLRTISWKNVLTKDDVEEWIAMNKLWDETFNKFNV